MTELLTSIRLALKNAEQLKASKGSKAANEANTRALVIEPVLAALGWNLTDLGEVDREYAVAVDGTRLDYALKIAGERKLFVEAKAVGKDLSNGKFVSQTINYANNLGVMWCVLTNGLSYRVYKTNEPVEMDKKLLLAVDLADVHDDPQTVLKALQRISRHEVATEALDAYGEQVFADHRVRGALAKLAADPPEELFKLLESRVAKPVPPREQLLKSLKRILDVTDADGSSIKPAGPLASGGGGPGDEKGGSGGGAKPPKLPYGLEHHTGGKPASVVDLFEQADEYIRALGEDVVRNVAKVSINYRASKRPFGSIKLMTAKVVMFLVLDPPASVARNPDAMRDVSNIGHHGNGHVEYSLRTSDQLAELKQLVAEAYAAAH